MFIWFLFRCADCKMVRAANNTDMAIAALLLLLGLFLCLFGHRYFAGGRLGRGWFVIS